MRYFDERTPFFIILARKGSNKMHFYAKTQLAPNCAYRLDRKSEFIDEQCWLLSGFWDQMQENKFLSQKLTFKFPCHAPFSRKSAFFVFKDVWEILKRHFLGIGDIFWPKEIIFWWKMENTKISILNDRILKNGFWKRSASKFQFV